MPIYEYRCEDCRTRMTVWARTVGEPAPACSRCASRRVVRILSRFASPRSEDARMAALADPSSLTGLDEHDPQSVARWMKKMGREMGEDLGEGMEEEIDRAVDDTSDDASTPLQGDLEE